MRLPDPAEVAKALHQLDQHRTRELDDGMWGLADLPEFVRVLAAAADAYADAIEVCGHRRDAGGYAEVIRCGAPRDWHTSEDKAHGVKDHDFVPARLIVEDTG